MFDIIKVSFVFFSLLTYAQASSIASTSQNKLTSPSNKNSSSVTFNKTAAEAYAEMLEQRKKESEASSSVKIEPVSPSATPVSTVFNKTAAEAYAEMLQQQQASGSVTSAPVSPSVTPAKTVFTKTAAEAYAEMLEQRKQEAQASSSVKSEPVLPVVKPASIVFTKTAVEAYAEMLEQRKQEALASSSVTNAPVSPSVTPVSTVFTKTAAEAYAEMLQQQQASSSVTSASVSPSVKPASTVFTKTAAEAYAEMLEQRKEEVAVSSDKKEVARAVASVEEEEVQESKSAPSTFVHASSIESPNALTSNEKANLLREDGEFTRYRLVTILNSLQSLEKEESIKDITYLGSRKLESGENYFNKRDDGVVEYLTQETRSAGGKIMEGYYRVHSYDIKPIGKISVLQRGKSIYNSRMCVISETAEEELCYVVDGATKQCKVKSRARQCTPYDKPIKDESKPRLIRVAINELSDSVPMFQQLPWSFRRPGFFRSLSTVKEEKGDSSTLAYKVFRFEFSICANKIKIIAPKNKSSFSTYISYKKLGGEKEVGSPSSACQTFSASDLQKLDFESIESNDDSNFKKNLKAMGIN